MKKTDARKTDTCILRGIATASVIIAALFVALLAAGPAGAFDPRICSCLEQVFLAAMFVTFVGSSLAMTRRTR